MSLAEELVRTLSRTGREGWCVADHMSELYVALARDKSVDREVAVMFDPAQLELIMDSGRGGTLERTVERLKQVMTDTTPLVFFPLNYDAHWSLLVYHRHYNTWYACDSIWTPAKPGAPSQSMHHDFVRQVLTRMTQLGVPLPEGGTQMFIEDLPRQADEWECGRFTLGYMAVFMSPTGRRLWHDRALYEQWLKEHLAAVNMGTLPLFTVYLKELALRYRRS